MMTGNNPIKSVKSRIEFYVDHDVDSDTTARHGPFVTWTDARRVAAFARREGRPDVRIVRVTLVEEVIAEYHDAKRGREAAK